MPADISFASFNLYNFQQVGEHVYRKVIGPELYAKKVQWTRDKVLEVDADIIAFQELWSRKCLDDVFDTPALQGYTPVYIKDSLIDPWYNIAVAAAVRSPWTLKEKTVIKKFPFTNIQKFDHHDGEDDQIKIEINQFSRSILKLRIAHTTSASTPEITVFAGHLKSKIPSYTPEVASDHRTAIGSAVSTIRRTAEATALRWILTDHMKRNDIPTVLLGDLNDDPRSNTLALLSEQPSMTRTARGGDTALYNAALLQQLMSFRDVYYTHEYNKLKDILDHILVSQEFFVNSTRRKWKLDETKIWNDFLNDTKDYTGDHGIIKASFT